MYRETLPDTSLLEGDIVVGIPLAVDDTAPHTIATAVPSAPFHLFFPPASPPGRLSCCTGTSKSPLAEPLLRGIGAAQPVNP